MDKDKLLYQLELTRMYQGKQYVLLGLNETKALVYDLSTGLSGLLEKEVVNLLEMQGRILNDSEAEDVLKISNSRLKSVMTPSSQDQAYVYVFHRYTSKGKTKGFFVLVVNALRNVATLARYSNQFLLDLAEQDNVILLNAKKTVVQGVDVIQGINGSLIEKSLEEVQALEEEVKKEIVKQEEENPFIADAKEEHKYIKMAHKRFLTKVVKKLVTGGLHRYSAKHKGYIGKDSSILNIKALALVVKELFYSNEQLQEELGENLLELTSVLNRLAFGYDDVMLYSKQRNPYYAYEKFSEKLSKNLFRVQILSVQVKDEKGMREMTRVAHRLVADFIANTLGVLEAKYPNHHFLQLAVKHEILDSSILQGLDSERTIGLLNSRATDTKQKDFEAKKLGAVESWCPTFKTRLDTMLRQMATYLMGSTTKSNTSLDSDALSRIHYRNDILVSLRQLSKAVEDKDVADGFYTLESLTKLTDKYPTLKTFRRIIVGNPNRGVTQKKSPVVERIPTVTDLASIKILHPTSEMLYNWYGYSTRDVSKQVDSPFSSRPITTRGVSKIENIGDLVDNLLSPLTPVGQVYFTNKILTTIQDIDSEYGKLNQAVNLPSVSKHKKAQYARSVQLLKGKIKTLNILLLIVGMTSTDTAKKLLHRIVTYGFYSDSEATIISNQIDTIAYQYVSYKDGTIKDTDVLGYLEELESFALYGMVGKENVLQFNPFKDTYYPFLRSIKGEKLGVLVLSETSYKAFNREFGIELTPYEKAPYYSLI